MSEQANSFKLGLFVIIAFLLGAAALAVLGAGDVLKKEFLAETCFDSSVQGLDIGSPVKYRGISIGKVKAITGAASVYNVKSDYVLVVMALNPDICLRVGNVTMETALKQSITEGLYVQLALQGLTGSAYLEMDFSQGPRSTPLELSWTPENLYIPSEPSAITKLGDSLGSIMRNLESINIQGLTRNIQELFALMHAKLTDLDIKAISTQVNLTLEEIRETNRNLNDLLGSDKISKLLTDAGDAAEGIKEIIDQSKKPLASTVENARTAAESAAHLTGELESSLIPVVDRLSEKLTTILGSLERTSDQLETIVWTNGGGLDDIVANLKLATENLKQMSQDLRRYPSRLIFEKTPEPVEETR